MKILTVIFLSLAILPAMAAAPDGSESRIADPSGKALLSIQDAAASGDEAAGVLVAGETFLRPLQDRDSTLVGDQFLYGFVLEASPEGASYALPDLSKGIGEGLEVVRGWAVDSLLTKKQKKARRSSARRGEAFSPGPVDLEISLVVAPFEDGQIVLPPLSLLRSLQGPDGPLTDTLVFSPQALEVFLMPVDTANFEIRDIKGQIRYPLTWEEVLPWLLGGYAAVVILGLLIGLPLYLRRKESIAAPSDPAHIVALRGLEKYRGNAYWAPERQKTMYSGITDTLRTYIEKRFGIGAEEMTTAEIFSALEGDEGLPADVYAAAKELFELSDFVKFAKHTASDEQNASALPTAVRFVTSTYQSSLDEESAAAGDKDKD